MIKMSEIWVSKFNDDLLFYRSTNNNCTYGTVYLTLTKEKMSEDNDSLEPDPDIFRRLTDLEITLRGINTE